jgi:hypothetical protein
VRPSRSEQNAIDDSSADTSMFSMVWLPTVTGVARDTETAPFAGIGSVQALELSVNAE